MAQATVPFKIPQAILTTVSATASKIPAGGIVSSIRQLARHEGYAAELCMMIVDRLSYRDFVALALTCKSMASTILSDPLYIITAASEEANHSALGHYQQVMQARLGFSQHPSALRCSHYTCPFYMRTLRDWSRKVKQAMDLRRRLNNEPPQVDIAVTREITTDAGLKTWVQTLIRQEIVQDGEGEKATRTHRLLDFKH